ncbi:organoarsenical effux MFS transporter ArsJ [Pleionea sediminis]|uniref:organoarsenical effux MFS transporter ArsJ n=1 Tax=Pleionea sediminis TaxID=2569479 RepID=UPI001185F423|nr:organoarsenical effux MFS transporter ArsJ [Pleionea sediminis]
MAVSSAIKQYLIVTFNYWAFTLTDGALRMLVVLHFHNLGYSALEVAMLFLFYEFFGVVTNLLGGYLGARIGLNKTMNIGLFLQIVALSMLLVPTEYLVVIWVMSAQAVSGIAKDLNKMSAKSAIKTFVSPEESKHSSKLYRWVAALTGSKNALKGVGFFLGGFLLTTLGFHNAISIMAIMLFIIWILSLVLLKKDLGKAKSKPKFKQLFSKSRAINVLSAARFFLFASRDVWFVVALPVYFSTQLNWSHTEIGSFFAVWIIGYGIVQALAPKITHRRLEVSNEFDSDKKAFLWVLPLMIIPGSLAFILNTQPSSSWVLTIGLITFAIFFAINSALHSFLIVHHASDEGISLDVGFYYMANAAGRLIGTVLSGIAYQVYGLTACLWISFAFLLATMIITLDLPSSKSEVKCN